MRARVRQQAAVAQFGQRALAGADPSTLMDEAVALVADVLEVEHCKVLELLPEGDALLLRAGVGWRDGLVGQATVPANGDSQAGYTLSAREPVIVEDLARETRFRGPPLLLEHGIVSGMSVVIAGNGRPFGVLGAHTTRRRTFSRDDANFLQAVANVLATAIARKQAEEEVQSLKELSENVVQSSPLGIHVIDRNFTVRSWNSYLEKYTAIPRDEIVGRNLFDVIPRLADGGWVEAYRQVMTTGQPLRRDNHIYVRSRGPRKGERLCQRLQVVPLREDGQVVGAVTIVEDVTELKRAEEALRQRERFLRRQNQVLVKLARSESIERGDLKTALREITEAAARTLEVERASVWLYNEDRSAIRCLDLYELSRRRHSEGRELAAAQYPAYFRALERQRTIAASDARRDPRTREFRESYLEPLGITSMLDAPVRVGGRLVGVICHEHVGPPRRWSAEEEGFAGSMADFVSLALEASERRRTEEALRTSEEQYRELFENANDIVYTHDLAGRFTSINRAAERVAGYSREEALQMNIAQIVAPEHLPRALEMIRRKVEKGGSTTYELEIVAKDGRRVPLEVSTRVIYRDGKPVGIQGIARDISERRQAEETIRRLAFHDRLTGLPNRSLLEDRIELALAQARRSGEMLAVMSLDLDRFKLINDTLGHTVGDRLLMAVAQRLATVLREGDSLARVSGDEFVFLLPRVRGAEEAARLAEKVQDALAEPFVLDGHELHTTTSIGISLYPHDGESAQALLQNADAAMYRAKEEGRNRYQLYTPLLNARAFQRLTLENDLRRAMERGEFILHYQPKVEVASGRVIGVEALVRWQHPHRGLIPPADFIPLAEETGVILPLGEWVLRIAAAEVMAWRRAGLPPLQVAVNLSARQLQEGNLVETVRRALEDTGLRPDALELEITEGSAMENAAFTAAALRELADMGIRISIDDFGSGYSSLSRLKEFPLHSLKMDRSFVRDLTEDPNDAAIASAIIAMAHSLGLRVTAEGVEQEGQLSFLRKRGCDEFQGFLFARPMPADALAKMLREAYIFTGRPGTKVTP